VGLLNKHKGPFWERPPITSTDPAVLYQFGIMSISRQRHEDAIRTGWTLWSLTGLDQHMAWDFVYDGFQGWRASADPALVRAFLTAVFERSLDPRNGSTSTGQVATARCWAGMRLLEYADGDRDALRQRLRAEFSAIPEAWWTPEVNAFMSADR
jgi:hypothetical protein